MQTIDNIRVMSYKETGLPTYIPYERQGSLLMGWCKKNNAMYYARPREEFCLHEAVRLAHDGGFGTVVVEDMS